MRLPCLAVGAALATLTSAGSATAATRIDVIASAATATPDGGVVVGGTDRPGTDGRGVLVRLRADGRPDARFGGGDGRAAITVQFPRTVRVRAGRVLVVGAAYQGNAPRERCAYAAAIASDGTGRRREPSPVCGAAAQVAVDPVGVSWMVTRRSVDTGSGPVERVRLTPTGRAVVRARLRPALGFRPAGLAFVGDAMLASGKVFAGRSELAFLAADGRVVRTGMRGDGGELHVRGDRFAVVVRGGGRPDRLALGTIGGGRPVVRGVAPLGGTAAATALGPDGRLWVVVGRRTVATYDLASGRRLRRVVLRGLGDGSARAVAPRARGGAWVVGYDLDTTRSTVLRIR